MGREQRRQGVLKKTLTDFVIHFKIGTKTVALHIPADELDKVAYMLYAGLKKEGIICSIEEEKP